MSTDTSTLCQTITGQLYLSEQLDALHLDLVALRDMSHEGELDLILEQTSKSTQQKFLYLEKIVGKLLSPELRNTLQLVLHEKDLDFFGGKRLPSFLGELRQMAEHVVVVKVTVAIRFKPADLQEMGTVLSQKIGDRVAFDLRVDRSLIGGIIIQHGNYISDYSIKTRLDQFRENWEKAVVEG